MMMTGYLMILAMCSTLCFCQPVALAGMCAGLHAGMDMPTFKPQPSSIP